jgi:hypothetical protein
MSKSLLSRGVLVTMNPKHQVIDDGAVLIRNNRNVENGPSGSPRPAT